MPIFDWTEKDRWLKDVEHYASSLLSKKIKNRLKIDRPDCWSDDFNWLINPDISHDFTELFKDYYTHLRCYHGGRPVDVGSYLKKGILGQEANAIERYFLKIFSDAPKEALEETLKEFEARKEQERGKLWVVLEASELVQDCGHYLIQGSEYMMALAATLSGIYPKEDYRLRLRKIGIPTIFETHIPVSYFTSYETDGLAHIVLSEWGQKASGNDLGMGHSPCLVLHRDIEPDLIINHKHPIRINDPHFGNAQYKNPHTHCDFCIY